jgi:hypothetical protein
MLEDALVRGIVSFSIQRHDVQRNSGDATAPPTSVMNSRRLIRSPRRRGRAAALAL